MGIGNEWGTKPYKHRSVSGNISGICQDCGRMKELRTYDCDSVYKFYTYEEYHCENCPYPNTMRWYDAKYPFDREETKERDKVEHQFSRINEKIKWNSKYATLFEMQEVIEEEFRHLLSFAGTDKDTERISIDKQYDEVYHQANLIFEKLRSMKTKSKAKSFPPRGVRNVYLFRTK